MAQPVNNEDARKYAAARFYNYGLEVAQVGFDKSSTFALDTARTYFKAAKMFDPDDEDIKQKKGSLDNILQAHELYDALSEDSQVSSGLTRLAALYVSDAINHKFENRDDIVNSIVKEIFSVDPIFIINSVRKIRTTYFPIYKLNDGGFDKILELAQENQKKKKEGCFLTTACVSYAGLPDDCFELQTLRNFRDHYLASSIEGQNLIQQYYTEAPRIVDLINLDLQRELILNEILKTVRKCVDYICCQRHSDALECYTKMFYRLRAKYLD